MEATTSSNAKLLAPTDFKSERKPSANVLRSPKVQSHGDPDFRKQHVRIPPSPRPNRRLETKKFHSNSPSTDKACEVETIIPQSSAHPKFSPSTFCQSLPEAPRRLSVSTTDSSLSFENKSDSSSPHVESWLPRAQGSPVTNTLLPSWSLRPDPISSEASEESREWNFLNHVSPRSKLGNAPNQQISTRSQGINNSIVSTKPFPNIHAKPGTSPTDFLQREHNSAASPPSSTDLESSPPSSTFARLLHAQSDHGISLTSVGSSKSNYSTDDVSFAELRSKQPSSSPATQTAFRINPPAIVHRSATSDHLSKSFYTHNHGSPSTLEDRRELLRLRQQLAHKHDLDLQQEDLKKNTNFETDSRRGRLKGILHRRGSDPPVISTDIVKRISKPAPDCSRSDAMPYANSSSMSSVLTGKPSIAPRFLRRSPCPDAFPSAAFSPPYSPSSAPSGAAPKAAALLGIPPSQESRLSAFNISSSQADIHNSVYVSQKHLKGTSPYVSESREEKRNRVSRINRWLGAVAPSPNEGKFRVSENNLEDSFYLKSIDHEQSKSRHLDNDGGRLSNKSHKEHESLRFRKYNEVPSSSANAHTMQGHMRSTLNPERTSVQDSKANELNIPNRLKNQIYPNTFGEPPSTHYLTHDASTRTRIVPKQIHPIHENSGQLSVSSVYSTSLGKPRTECAVYSELIILPRFT